MGRGKRAAIYVRISQAQHTDHGVSDLGVRRQEADCRELCDRRGWQVAALFTDNDVSAYSGRRRPGYQSLIDAVKAGDVDAVVAWHPDRLHRSPVELEGFIALIDASGADVATVVAGDYDLTTSAGRMTARIVGAVARGESEHKAERIRSKMKELAMIGQSHGGGNRRPYGFDTDRRTIIPAEAKVVRELARRLLAGESLRALAADLNRRGVPTIGGQPWTPQALRSMILRERLAGLRVHQGEVVGRGDWKPILPAGQHRQVVALLTDPARRTNRTARTYLLSGLVRCARCGQTMKSNAAGGRRTQACLRETGGCGRMRIAAEPLEAEVVEQLLYAASSGDLAARLRAPAPSTSADDLATVAGRLNDLAEDWAAGTITRPEWHAARAVLGRQLDELRALEAAEVRDSAAYVNVDDLEARWSSMTFDQQRAVVAKVVRSVVVAPATTTHFDPDRVTVEWRA